MLLLMKFIFQNQRVKEWRMKYEQYISPLALISGFVVDNLTLRRIDLWAENLVIILYLIIAGASILILNINARNIEQSNGLVAKIADFLPFVLQFVFGGLFSVFVVFYIRSASLLVSWPFLIFLIFFLIGNEAFREKYLRLIFQLCIYFIAVFSYSIFVVPIILKKIDERVFFLSGLVSLALIALFIFVIYKIMPEKFKQARNIIFLCIGGIYLVFNIFYFTNIIPPIPLALKESGIYHSVVWDGKNYIVQFEPAPWYRFFDDFNRTFHWQRGSAVYSFSAIFSPTNLNIEIFHRWLYFDAGKGEWVERDKIGYDIIGGRDGGYRGYTLKYNVAPGKWRVDVVTSRDQLLGRNTFSVVEAHVPPELEKYIQ